MTFGLPPPRTFAIGDTARLYVRNHQGEKSEGKIVAVLDLPGWSWPHYVIEIDTGVDPILEVRDGYTAWHAEPPAEFNSSK